MVLVGQWDVSGVVFWTGSGVFFALALLAGRVRRLRYVAPVVPVVMLGLLAVLGEWEGARDFVNWLAGPERLLLLCSMALAGALIYYRCWTRPLFAGALFSVLAAAYFASAFDANFLRIISKPDNVPITLMVFSVGFFLWVAFRRMAINDRRRERGEPPAEGHASDQVLVWPDLLYAELIIMVLATVLLILWAIFLRAPLEAPADPATAPNPSKAPWYFAGLQELLVYFDPWIAGVLLPGLTIVGLCALPYLDRNPKGSGYYTLKERPLAITVFLFGFIVLWVVPIVIGTFLRGPNWNFFGPFEYWDPHRPTGPTSVNLSEVFWTNRLGRALPTRESAGSDYYPLIREAPGLIALGAYFLLTPALLRATVLRRLYGQMGGVRYAVMMLLLTCMGLVPIKMLLRWLFNLKYIVGLTEWAFNV